MVVAFMLAAIVKTVFSVQETTAGEEMYMWNKYTQCERTLGSGPALSTKVRNSLLAVLVFTALLTPTRALSAEREGTVLFFSFDDLKQELSHPSIPSLAHLAPSFTWRALHEQAHEDGPIERNSRWGHGLGFGGYANPRTPRPLWGY